MRVTVSIVNYKTPQLVAESVASVKRFAPTSAELDIAVVDNGSGDGSLEILRATHPDIRLIDAEKNLGFAGGNNLVLRGNTSDYIFLLNSDALVEHDTIDRLLAVLVAHPTVAAVGARIVNFSDGADQDFPRSFPSLFAMAQRALNGPEFPAAGAIEPVALPRLHGAGMMIRGDALRAVGLLDEGFFMYDEDVDWCTRALDHGFQLWLLPDVRVLHHGGGSSGRAPSGQRSPAQVTATSLRMRHELRRSRYRLYRKHRSVWEICALKIFTDSVLAAQSVQAGLRACLSPTRRAGAMALIRANWRIITLNPFELTPFDARYAA